jgi:acetylglutamate kinase
MCVLNEYSFLPLAAKCAEYQTVEVSRVVVLGSGCLIRRCSRCVDWKSNFITGERLHLDGQGHLQL